MRIFAAAKNSSRLLFLSLAASLMLSVVFAVRTEAVGVGIILCGSQSNITVTEPASDNIVMESELTVKGLVNQAAQIEVLLDDEFNSVVPLNLGQTTFETIVHLTPGTHTIKLTAINACDTGDDDATTIVVTYTAPPERNADGEAEINPVGDDGTGTGDQIESPQGLDGLLAPLRGTADTVLKIFDIRSFDAEQNYSQLTVARALILAVGMYIAVFGPSHRSLVKYIAKLPIVRGLGSDRKRTIAAKWVIRVAGLLLFIAALLL